MNSLAQLRSGVPAAPAEVTETNLLEGEQLRVGGGGGCQIETTQRI